MAEKKYTALENLTNIVPKNMYGPNVTMFVIALEGWRRGLQLKFFTKYVQGRLKIRFALRSEEKEEKFQLSLAEKVPKESRRTTRSKTKTKEYLIDAGIPTPQGKGFSNDVPEEEIIEFAKSIGFPLVIKPANASLGIGVTTNINDEETFIKTLKELRNKRKDDEVIVEQQVTGEDTRLFVVGDKVVGAFKRAPANVIGDGKHTIKELVDMKNRAREQHPHINGHPIKFTENVKELLKEQNYTVDSVPKSGEKVLLSRNSLVNYGGETVDVTDELTEESKRIAVAAVKTLDSLHVCGVDIMIDNERGTNSVLELNSRPNIGGSVMPFIGTPRDIPKEIVDFYFPESKGTELNEDHYKLVFDFEKIEEMLRSGMVDEVKVPNYPNKPLSMKKLTVSGKVQGVGFRKWVLKLAGNKKLNGFVKNLKNKKVLIVVAGDTEKVNDFIETIKNKKSKDMKVSTVDVEDWNKPVKVGFKIVKNDVKRIKELSAELKQLKQRNRELEELQRKAEKNLAKMENSTSWRITGPMRNVMKVLKKN